MLASVPEGALPALLLTPAHISGWRWLRFAVSWSAAPTCNPPVVNYTADSNGRLWGFQNGTSCVFK